LILISQRRGEGVAAASWAPVVPPSPLEDTPAQKNGASPPYYCYMHEKLAAGGEDRDDQVFFFFF